MRITAFWAKGYRSLADVHLDGLGPFNVFYGPNGAGKSNILAAMEALFSLLAWLSKPEHDFEIPNRLYHYKLNRALRLHDRSHFQRDQPLVLGARLLKTETAEDKDETWPSSEELIVEVTYDWFKQSLAITDLQFRPYTTLQQENRHVPQVIAPSSVEQAQQIQILVAIVARRMYALIEADRRPHVEGLRPAEEDPVLEGASHRVAVPAVLAAGRLKEGLFRASSHFNPRVRQRFKQLQELLTGAPLYRPPFELVYDPDTRIVDLVEQIPGGAHHSTEVSLDLAGLGIAQIYSILGQALLRGTYAVAIEEPEAHLHAPTNGIHLRHLLERLVTEGYLGQLFIATHSNLFDLDPTGYYDVSLDEQGATRVERKPLSEIDRQHLYEPGPAKHALAEFLRYMEADAIVFRRPDGSPISVSEMLDMLQRDDNTALEFLRDVHGAAVRAVRVKHKKPPAPAGES